MPRQFFALASSFICMFNWSFISGVMIFIVFLLWVEIGYLYCSTFSENVKSFFLFLKTLREGGSPHCPSAHQNVPPKDTPRRIFDATGAGVIG
jgi:hypothetical protein